MHQGRRRNEEGMERQRQRQREEGNGKGGARITYRESADRLAVAEEADGRIREEARVLAL
jgi:hypothetical protein